MSENNKTSSEKDLNVYSDIVSDDNNSKLQDHHFHDESTVKIPVATKVDDNIDNSIPAVTDQSSNIPAYTSFPTTSQTYYAEIPPEDVRLQKCWQYGKSVKYIAFIDSLICILNSFISLICKLYPSQ